MELIFAKVVQSSPLELQEVTIVDSFNNFEMILSLQNNLEDNDFELELDIADWKKCVFETKGWIYVPNTEWVGRIENIEHHEGTIKLSGPTLRGMISRWYLMPPSTFWNNGAYVKIDHDLGEVVEFLLATYDSESNILNLRDAKAMFHFVENNFNTNVQHSFRYTNTLSALNRIASDYSVRLQLKHEYGASRPFVASYEHIQDLTNDVYFNQDYDVNISSKRIKTNSYNVVVGLGQGELQDRQIITRYRLPNGNIVSNLTTSQKESFEPRVYVYDYSSVESIDELEKGVIEKLVELNEKEEISIKLDPLNEVQLGDIVGGYDEVTDIRVEAKVIEKKLIVNENGYNIEYKTGVV